MTRYDPLVLECQGRFIIRRHKDVGNTLSTRPNADGVQTSWLVSENVTTSAKIKCFMARHRCTTLFYIKVFGESDSEYGILLYDQIINYVISLHCTVSD